jgi:hypothetical protein
MVILFYQKFHYGCPLLACKSEHHKTRRVLRRRRRRESDEKSRFAAGDPAKIPKKL